jgi:putative tricarboxylic transport membrane protein
LRQWTRTGKLQQWDEYTSYNLHHDWTLTDILEILHSLKAAITGRHTMLRRRTVNWFWFLIFIGPVQLWPVNAEESLYPQAPIKIVVPYGVGGNADLAARALSSAAPDLKALNGQPLVVINRSGAGGIVGSESVVHATNDGYTLLLGRVGTHAVATALDPAVPYKWDSFSFIGRLQTDPYVCVVKGDSSFKSFKEVLAAIKSSPKKLLYATTGNMDASVAFPVSAFLLANLSVEAAVKVPFKGAPETTSALLAGLVSFSCNALSPYLGSIRGGNLRALVVSTPQRVTNLPDVPTVSELGMKDLEAVSGWSALYGPPDLPKNVIQTWASALEELKHDDKWRATVLGMGSIPSILPPEETRQFAKDQYDFYRTLSPHMGIGK